MVDRLGVSKKGVLDRIHNHEDEDEVKTEEPKKKRSFAKESSKR